MRNLIRYQGWGTPGTNQAGSFIYTGLGRSGTGQVPNVPLRVVYKHACRDFPGGAVINSALPRARDAAEWRTELSQPSAKAQRPTTRTRGGQINRF